MFHVVHIKFHGVHRGYEIWHLSSTKQSVMGTTIERDEPVVRLRDMFTPKGVPCSCFKRHEAYDLVRRWNNV